MRTRILCGVAAAAVLTGAMYLAMHPSPPRIIYRQGEVVYSQRDGCAVEVFDGPCGYTPDFYYRIVKRQRSLVGETTIIVNRWEYELESLRDRPWITKPVVPAAEPGFDLSI